jgi:hypothetical protein
MNFFQRRKILKNANYLDLTPVCAKKHLIGDDEKVTVIIPKFTNKFVVEKIVPKLKHPDMKLNLDEIGSAVWLLIDGKKKVKEIALELSQKFGDKIQPVDERLTKFLTQLYEQRLITFDEIKGA